MNVPNPMNNPMDLSFIMDIPYWELVKIAIAGTIGIGLLIYWISKKLDKFEDDNPLGSFKFDIGGKR